jgi:predicted nucleic acid-binding protein
VSRTLVIDASVAIKWVIPESQSDLATALRRRFRFAAPELIVAECANILWKKTRRGEISPAEAVLAARSLERADIEFVPARPLSRHATELSILLDHPAYDCFYLCAAKARGEIFVTADERLVRKLNQPVAKEWTSISRSLSDSVQIEG